ncbi:response regulator [Anaerorhabdus furcosa]|uniref:Two-component system, OmpR family, KDP operon response regulator KdpE n=1 Tax=Anaerorhabdus furcosa TaxID=118967 RepID=A0A1T4QAB2_9FIRM|nr:response regulator transcription factor [Anaerorhabdus furcosa]SKA00461.1 two-component system, OmpR family, KDP operon response regulator KdpE [Anaerorhabdus furcosa]
MTVKTRILIVEDDNKISNFISFALQQEGFITLAAKNGQTALSLLVSEQIDIMLLDLGLPDFDGMEVLRKIREWSEIPVIIVSARDQDKEKAMALDAGADDYLTKPFSVTELLARVRVALRHFYRQNNQKIQNTIKVKNLEINFEKRLVYLADKEIHLTPLEYSLLSLFFKNVGKVLTTSYIIKEVWGVGYGEDTQALRALMAGLRRKIEQNPAKPIYLLTEIGVGYRLIDE